MTFWADIAESIEFFEEAVEAEPDDAEPNDAEPEDAEPEDAELAEHGRTGVGVERDQEIVAQAVHLGELNFHAVSAPVVPGASCL